MKDNRRNVDERQTVHNELRDSSGLMLSDDARQNILRDFGWAEVMTAFACGAGFFFAGIGYARCCLP